MSLLIHHRLRHVLHSSSSPVEVLLLRIFHPYSSKIGAPAQINLVKISNYYVVDECLKFTTHIDECLAVDTRSWADVLAAFKIPGFKCVYLGVVARRDFFLPDSDDEDEENEERISSFKLIMEKLCPVLATYPFQLFDLRFEGMRDKYFWRSVSGIPGRILEALSSNTSLQHLTLRGMDEIDWQLSPALNSALASSSPPSALQTLNLWYADISAVQVMGIFKALEKNTTLSSLGLVYCDAVDGKEVYEAIIDLLSINLTLKTLDLEGTPLMEKNPAGKRTIKDMLRSSNEVEAGLSKFSTSTVQPTTTRVFFCGEGFAGKSTLQKSMANLLLDVGKRMKQEMYNLVCFKGKQVLRRTTGIEVSSVNHEGLEILFWDLAGQTEYHAYHDFMFPNEQGPSLFLVVCSLIHNISSQHQLAGPPTKSGKLKTKEEILGELRYWLLYISSNTKKISRRTPHVSFVFTHIDMITTWETDAIDFRVQVYTKELEQEFAPVAKVVGTFFINACNHDSVRPVVQHALKECKEIVNSCQPIYSVCNNAKKMLAKWIKHHPHEPWMKVDDFIRLCSRLFQRTIRHKEFHDVIMAVLSSLHHTGSLIYFNDLGLVLVNLQWFCKDFMGGILEQTTQLPNLEKHTGLWKREEIKGILEILINLKVSKRNKYHVPRKGSSSMTADQGPELDVEKLVEIMIELELCFEDVSRNSFFIPATLCQSQSQTNRRWTAEMGSDHVSYVGRRLKCHDEKLTFLPPGFFPRLQVHLNKLFKEMSYEVEKNLIKIVVDRKEVLIEFNETPASFIDIMVRFSKSKALDDVLQFISNTVIEDIRDLKSRTRCWQGVDLIEVALRPSCVKDLVQPEIKINQCVSLEKLTSKVQLENDSVGDIKSLTHVWDTLEAASLCQECTPIIELLGEKCFTSILVKRIVQVEELSKQVGIHDSYGASSSGDHVDPSPFKRHNSMQLIRSSDADMYDMKLQLKRMEQKIDAMAKDVKDVKDAVHKMLEQKEKLIPEIQKLFAELHGDINAKIPQLFLFNEVDGTLISKLVPGMSNLKLHFMCESKPMPHLPLDQQGIKITTLDEGVVKSLLPYMHFLLSTLALGFKLGAPLANAHGLKVPDLSSLIEGLLSASRGIIDRSKVPCRSEAIDPVIKEKARIWLQNFMRGEECDNPNQILSRFKLMKHCGDGRCAWLCDYHYHQAASGKGF